MAQPTTTAPRDRGIFNEFTREPYDLLRRAAGIPSVYRPDVFPQGVREEAWLLANPRRIQDARQFATAATMLFCGADGWAAPGDQITFAMTRRAILRYLDSID